MTITEQPTRSTPLVHARAEVKEAVGGTWKEFRDFAFKGSVLDLAIGVVLGAAFNAVVQAVVADVLTPLIGVIGGNDNLAAATVNVGGAELKVGDLANTAIYFLITAIVLFLVVKAVAKVRRVPVVPAPATHPCRFCLEPVPVAARRCRHCTSDLTDQPLAPPPPMPEPAR